VLVNPAAPQERLEELPQQLPTVEPGLSLVDLESMALAGNPALHRAAALVAAARGNWLQVGLKPNPSVGYQGQQVGSGGLAEQQGVGFSQDIITGGKLRLNRSVAAADIEIARQEFQQLRLRVLTDVRVAYYQVLIADRQVQLSQQLISVAQQASKAASSLFNAKEVGRIDLLQAKLENDQAELTLQNARNRRQAAWQALAAVIGNPGLVPQQVLGDPDSDVGEITYDDALARLVSQSPEMSAAAAQLDRARAALARAQAQPFPNLNVQGLVNIIDNGIGGRPDGAVAVSAPLPLFNRNQGAIIQAQREVAAAQQAISQVQLDLQQRLAPVFEGYANARQQVSRYRQSILPIAQETLGLAHQTYMAGETNFNDLLSAQRTYTNVNRDYLDAVLRLRTAEAQIDGLLLTGSLQQQLEPKTTTPPSLSGD
jgi:cobalt-zinc-cadmium efflux system outer membrane protein